MEGNGGDNFVEETRNSEEHIQALTNFLKNNYSDELHEMLRAEDGTLHYGLSVE